MPTLARLRALTSLRYFRQHQAQWILALVGVATGVAAVVAVGLARESVQQAFEASRIALSGAATHTIVAGQGSLDRSAYASLRRTAGYVPMAPRIRAQVTGPDGMPWTLSGIDVVREAPFARAGSGADDGPAFPTADWFAGSPLVIVPAGTAPVGDTLRFTVGGEEIAATVAADYRVDAPGTLRVLLADIGTVARWLNRPGELDAIDVIAAAGDLEALQDALPAGARLEPVERATGGLTRAFDLNLTALSLLTALVGAFIVFNTFSFLVLQRRDLFALEHRLGVPLRSQRRQILLEALGTGIVGSGIGLAAGIALGEVTLRITRRTVSNLYFDVSGAALEIDPRVLLAGFMVGIAACVGAALWPARQVGSAERRRSGSAGWLLLVLTAGLAAGITLLVTPTGLPGALLGVFLTALAYAALGAPLLSRVTEPVVRAFPLQGIPLLGLSLRRLPRAVDRMLPAATALTLAVATVVGVATMIDSFRATVDDWLRQSLTADYYVATDGAPLDGSLPDQLRATAAIEAVSRFATSPARLGTIETELTAADLPAAGYAGFTLQTGTIDDLRARFDGEAVAVVSEALARRSGLGPGDSLTVETGRGEVTATVAAIASDYRAGTGRVTMSWQSVERQLGALSLGSMGLYAAPGATIPDVEAALLGALNGRPDLRLSDTTNIRALSLSIFDQTFEITRALQWIAAIVALVGLTGSLLALQLDRRRELRLLEALGMTAGERRRALRIEALLIGAVTCIFALPLGLLLAWALTAVINLRAFGWSLAPDFAGPALALGPVVALLGAWIAGGIAGRFESLADGGTS
ncbi:MAG: ABC transporter permease [Pseudomonadota bacterium]